MRRVKAILFAPFDLRKWFVIGFCAWLSSCGEGGGGGTGGNFNPGGGGGKGGNAREELRHAWDYVMDNLGWILPLVICVILVGFAIWLVTVWLNSRGKFMLLHCVALNRAEVSVPWNRYAQHAHSLFLFQVVLGLICLVIIAPLIIGALACLFAVIMGEGPTGPLIAGTVLGILLAIVCGIGIGIVKKLLFDFVVPIMYLRTVSVREAWSQFMALAHENLGRFVLYLLFSILIAMLIGMAVLLVVLITCCTAGCLMMIPYLGTVLLLPVFVFKRAYSLYYLEQYGPDYSVIVPDEPMLAGPASAEDETVGE